ncbi:hypothetical protein [Streptomyces fungicidicus]|uniref:hypothetical protein n=1 Tax=Streptomyces fungicidicus TaxID=68203 RepID=UPI00382299C5
MAVKVTNISQGLQAILGNDDISKYTLSEVLRAWIEYQRFTNGERLGVRQIADAAGMAMTRVSTTLSGRRVPARDELDMLCLALGLGKNDRVTLQDLRLQEETRRAHRRLQNEYQIRPNEIIQTSGDMMVEPTRRVRPQQPVPAFGQPDPIRVSSTKELVQALKAVHVWGGSPSLRELERRSRSALRRSTLSDMLRGEALPDYDRYIAFLRACGVDGANLDTWVFIWRRLKALETPEAAPWMPGTTML